MEGDIRMSDPRLVDLDGFRVEVDYARQRGDIVLDRPPFNVIMMPQREQLRRVFEALDEDPRGARDRAAGGG
jgi:2-oxoglutaroyl-CoA hydrolase